MPFLYAVSNSDTVTCIFLLGSVNCCILVLSLSGSRAWLLRLQPAVFSHMGVLFDEKTNIPHPPSDVLIKLYWSLSVSVFAVQSTGSSISSNSTDHGELVSRIKSLELENQSLHKGGFVFSFDQALMHFPSLLTAELFWCPQLKLSIIRTAANNDQMTLTGLFFFFNTWKWCHHTFFFLINKLSNCKCRHQSNRPTELETFCKRDKWMNRINYWFTFDWL